VDRYRELMGEYEEQQSETVKEILTVVASYHPVIEEVSATLAKLDVLTAFAEVSKNAHIPYVKPSVSKNNQDIVLKVTH